MKSFDQDESDEGQRESSNHQGNWTAMAPSIFEDLSVLASNISYDFQSPYARDSIYISFFDKFNRALYRQLPRHLLLVRDRGVGEKAVLLELARSGISGCPAFLKSKRFLFLDLNRLQAIHFTAIFEQHMLKSSSAESLIICIDGFANLFRIPDNRSGIPSFIALMLSCRCRFVGIVTPLEYEERFAANYGIRELFSVVNLPEPEGPTAMAIIRHFAKGLQSQYGVEIEDGAIVQANLLTTNFLLNERLPHKANLVLQSICEDLEYDRSQRGSNSNTIKDSDVICKVSAITGIPGQTLMGTGEIINYTEAFNKIIIGQEHAVTEVTAELGLIRAGMVDILKPASVMMFIGQTGTGKTEMAKALARFYSASRRLKTFTLGNFSEPHSVSGIIGVPPGYVGHEQGGRLVNELIADPYGVFLLDEADKAHPDVMQPFLNLFDEGWISDQRGNKAFAHRAIFILTTNVGQRQISDMCRSGKSAEEIASAMKESLSKIRHTKSNRPVFTPEFLARIKRIVVFKTLTEEAMIGISRHLISELQKDWITKRRKQLILPHDLFAKIGARAYIIDDRAQGREGGRIVRKLLAEIIEVPIQSIVSKQPDEYRECHQVSVTYELNAENQNEICARNISVSLCRANGSPL